MDILDATTRAAIVAAAANQTAAGPGAWGDAAGATNPTAAGVQSFTVTTLTAATAYDIRVQAENGSGGSGYTPSASSVTTDNPGDGGGAIGILVPLGTLTLTGNAPTVTVGGGQFIAVPRGTLTLTGYAPTVVGTVTDDEGGAPHEDIDAINEEIIQMVAMILASGVLACH